MKIIGLGDSLTFGNVGYSYLHFLEKQSYHYSNQGKNGDTVRGLYNRLSSLVERFKNDSEIYILGIGTNDVLLPYLKSVSLFWFLQMSLRCKLMRCIEDDEIFYQEYGKIVDFLHKNNKKVIIFGLPFVNLKGFPQEKLIKRNKLIEALAQKYDYPFIDIYRLQQEKIATDYRAYTWKYSFLIRVVDAVMMSLLPFTKDYFSRLRGLTTSVDGVHFNSQSAKILAKEIENHIKSQWG